MQINYFATYYLKCTESQPVTAIIMIDIFAQDIIFSDFSYFNNVVYCYSAKFLVYKWK